MNSKINGLPPLGAVPDVLLNAPKRNPAEAEGAAPVRHDDRVDLTSSARLLSQAGGAGDDAPVDALRVTRLREAIDNGSYRVDAQRIAERLLDTSRTAGKDD